MEVWKDIPGYEGKYQASTEGRIRSLDRTIEVNYMGSIKIKRLKGRVLRPSRFNKTGHVSVQLGDGSERKSMPFPVHQLIAFTFIGPRPAGMDVCHSNGNPVDNRLENLRYDTRSENNKDSSKQGKSNAKIKPETVRVVRIELAKGKTCRQIADEIGITKCQVSRIKRREIYDWVE